MHISAKAEYALRALLELAARHPEPATMRELVELQALPRSFAETILPGLRRAGFVRVTRVGKSGYALNRPPDQISVGSVIRAADGPLVRVRGLPPESLSYDGAARGLAALWTVVASRMSTLLAAISLQDLVRERASDDPLALVDTLLGTEA